MCWEAVGGEEGRVDVSRDGKELNLFSIYVLSMKAFMFIIHLNLTRTVSDRSYIFPFYRRES